jgi:hypothetical protein
MNNQMMNMNQIMMNQMMMNQMGNSDMNSNNLDGNQMHFNNNNFNDNSFNNIELRISNIVEPYEEKIKELEEKLRKKDFEIIVLKEKLFACQKQLNPNQINMNMNMNLPNLINNSQNDDSKIIVYFRFAGQKQNLPPFIEQCSSEEVFEDVLKRISYKHQFIYKKYKFIFNAKRINHNLTLGECGISNESNIFVVKPEKNDMKDEDEDEDIIGNISNNLDFQDKKLNIKFKTHQGAIFNLQLNQNRTIGMALELFIERMCLKKEEIDKICFLYNASKIDLHDSTSLKKLFKNNNNPEIIVHDVNNIIGA